VLRCASIAILISVVPGLDGCGGGSHPAATGHPSVVRAPKPVVTAPCNQAGRLARAPLEQEAGVYSVGPLLLVTGKDLAQAPDQQVRRGIGTKAIAVITGSRPVLLSVDLAAPVDVLVRFGGKSIGPGGAVRFPACGGRPHRFGGGIAFSGEGCARLHVSVAGGASQPLLIPVGNSLWGCPTRAAPESVAPEVVPFLGVACRVPNSIACDRVGVAVGFRLPAVLVMAEIDGRLVTLSPPGALPDDLWHGYLYRAGLRHGPLAVGIAPGATRWSGTPEVQPYVTVTVFFKDGTVASRTSRGLLHPGFG
jgi:hypothetical protein